MPISDYPKILRIVESIDSGEFGSASCPHCGADCRYYKTFDAISPSGGIVRLGAAAGCIKLFPISKLAERHVKLFDKQRSYARKGWALNRADSQIMDIIDSAAKGEIDEETALQQVRKIDADMREWRKRRGGGR